MRLSASEGAHDSSTSNAASNFSATAVGQFLWRDVPVSPHLNDEILRPWSSGERSVKVAVCPSRWKHSSTTIGSGGSRNRRRLVMLTFPKGRAVFWGTQFDCMSEQSIASAAGWCTWSLSGYTRRVARITFQQWSEVRSTYDRDRSVWRDPSPQ